MAKLLPLDQIPYAARAGESAARKAFATRDAAAQAAKYEIVDAEGCYSGAHPHSYGWVVTQAAAEAVSDELTHMPGNTSHHARGYKVWTGPL